MLIHTVLYFVNFINSAVESSLTSDISLCQSIFDEPYSNFDVYSNDNILTSEDFEWENCTFNTPDTSELLNHEKNQNFDIEQENDQSTFNAVESHSVSFESSIFGLFKNPEKEDACMAPEIKKSENSKLNDLKDNERTENIETKETKCNLICSEALKPKFESATKMNCNDKCDIISDKFKSDIKNAILKFIRDNISKRHIKIFIQRLESIERAYDVFKNFEHHSNLNTISVSIHDTELISLLKKMYGKFKNHNKFNAKTVENFLKVFDSEFKNSMVLLKIIFDNEQPVDFVRYNFYFELMKLYKYLDKIPELISLCGIYTNRTFCATPSILHLINLFLEHVGNIRENRVFILCLIKKAFMHSNRRDIDFFLVKKYKIICPRKHQNKHFLFWELGFAKRNDIRKKLKSSDILILNDVDNIHLKTIFLIYLYQHTYFLTFYKFNGKEFELFYNFFERVVFSKSCFACHFDEYLELIKRQIKGFE